MLQKLREVSHDQYYEDYFSHREGKMLVFSSREEDLNERGEREERKEKNRKEEDILRDEYYQWLLTQEIRSISDEAKYQKFIDMYLFEKSYENRNNKRDTWSTIYTLDESIYSDENLRLNLRNGFLHPKGEELYKKVREIISLYFKLIPYEKVPKKQYKCGDKECEWDSFSIKFSRKFAVPKQDLMRMALRYKSASNFLVRERLSKEIVKELYSKYGIKGEAFTTPLTSHFLDYKDTFIFGYFPDVDEPFNSYGHFTAKKYKLPKNDFIVVTPCYDQVALDSLKRCIEIVSKNDKNGNKVSIIFITQNCPFYFENQHILHLFEKEKRSPFLIFEQNNDFLYLSNKNKEKEIKKASQIHRLIYGHSI